jgi:hypothetical protein
LICIEQNLGPHIEQKCASAAPRPATVANAADGFWCPSRWTLIAVVLYMTNHGGRYLLEDIAPHVEAGMTKAAEESAIFALQHFPVYRRKENLKGFFLGGSLASVNVIGNEVAATFSLWHSPAPSSLVWRS